MDKISAHGENTSKIAYVALEITRKCSFSQVFMKNLSLSIKLNYFSDALRLVDTKA